MQTASVYVKIVLDTQNCILFCVFEIFIWDFYAKSIFDVCWILSSFPLRGVWIEMKKQGKNMNELVVVPLAGSVDRNTTSAVMAPSLAVVPLAGSVDRNRAIQEPPPWLTGRSPLRGVWIEIMVRLASWGTCAVAPLAGSVDRNTTVYTDYANYNRSLPSRGAWIKMGSSCPGRSFWLICAPFRLSRGAVLPGCTDGRSVPQPVGQGFPAASKAPAPQIWPNAAFCRPAACHFWEEAPDSGTGPAAERDAAAGCRHPKPAESLSSAPPSSRAGRKSI